MTAHEHPTRIALPSTPADQSRILTAGGVAAWREPLEILTYSPAAPNAHPRFFDRRVYQGSSGRVYPLPFIESIDTVPRMREWDAIHLENEWIRLVILPELGGRIHIGQDKTTGYDFFYRNNVIKPALVGLTGPWISGGVEFNWPQHHRPATFLPVDALIERSADGSVVAWNSDHDPFARMKGMHGVRLHPDRAIVQLDVRLHNRTDDTQTFLWWANAAARAHDDYQSFFPADVRWVADHARRAVTAFPRADRPYYGYDYPAKAAAGEPDADRLDSYRNIRVPTSYMVPASRDDFFGGYDHRARAGFVHWADHRIAPGKKQWTWGNAPFGHAWDAQLTDDDGPYVELMAGVFTDNQPDFSYLAPGETREFSQSWYPIAEIGPANQATLRAAVSLTVTDGVAMVGVSSTARVDDVTVELVEPSGRVVAQWPAQLAPDLPFTVTSDTGVQASQDVEVVVRQGADILIRWRRPAESASPTEPEIATEPPSPQQLESSDELYLTGVHLAQYRHPTRSPRPYWREALRRDAGDARSNTALAAELYRDGRYAEAEQLLRAALARLTRRNQNPADGEASYRLGLTLGRLGRTDESADAFAKAAWDAKWAHPAHHRLAVIAAAEGRDAQALAEVVESLCHDSRDNRARCLEVILLRRLGRMPAADERLAALRAIDPLDQWARALDGAELTADARTLVDIALDFAAVGEQSLSLELLQRAADAPTDSAGNLSPTAHYLAALVAERAGDTASAAASRRRARSVDSDHCLPAGLDSYDALAAAIEAEPDDALAHDLLGMWLYDRDRPEEALTRWKSALALGRKSATLARNAAMATFNVAGDGLQATRLYREAIRLAPDDARLRFEADQLAKRLSVSAAERIAALEQRLDLVSLRDDLVVEFAELLTEVGRPLESRALLESRPLHPWEGGEGFALAAHERACLSQARGALALADPHAALTATEATLMPPASLGEARHELDSLATIWLVRGDAFAAAGLPAEARRSWTRAIRDGAGPRAHQPRPADHQTVAVALAAERLGLEAEAAWAHQQLAARILQLRTEPATIPYFATSLPSLLLFDDDLQQRAADEADRLESLLGDRAATVR